MKVFVACNREIYNRACDFPIVCNWPQIRMGPAYYPTKASETLKENNAKSVVEELYQ